MTATLLALCLMLTPVASLDAPTGGASLYSFYDDFDDNDISDWDNRCAPGVWWAEAGCARGSTGSTPAALTPESIQETGDCLITTRAKGQHAFGVVFHLDSHDSGICAYVSPDDNVARIRRIVAGQLDDPLVSLSAPFPSGQWYELYVECSGQSIGFTIEVPATGDSWYLVTIDPAYHPGDAGLLMGDESGAYWDWFEVAAGAQGSEGLLHSIEVDDDMSGESSGDDDGAFEAGEEIELTLLLWNTGTETLTNVFAVLQSLESGLTVTDNYEDYGDIPPGEIVYPDDDFGVLAQSWVPDGEHDYVLNVFADGGLHEELQFMLPTGCGITCDVEPGFDPWHMGPLASPWGSNWHVSTQRNHTPGGDQSFKCGDTGSGDYDNELYCILASPGFNIPRNAELSFWMWIDAQCVLSDADLALDGGLIRLLNQCDEAVVTPSGGYPYEIVSSTSGPFDPGAGVFSGTSGWQKIVIQLPESCVGPRILGLVFGTDDSGTREGWYIDDLCVVPATGIEEDEPGPGQVPLSVSASPVPFSEATTFLLTGTGGEGADLMVFDAAGRLVRSMHVKAASPGQGQAQVIWDGSDQSGTRLPPGVYFATCQSAGQHDSVRLVRIP
ncbi:hypothetical protein JW921_07305 [Candidatus Fermentibacterales bacterium]|nr:hypothetical protein [Candidatus Fermentibacterales bacterium]